MAGGGDPRVDFRVERRVIGRRARVRAEYRMVSRARVRRRDVAVRDVGPRDRRAEIVQRFLPEAEITFEADEGGREASGLYLMDNSRLVEEFEVEFAPFDQRVMETISEARGEG